MSARWRWFPLLLVCSAVAWPTAVFAATPPPPAIQAVLTPCEGGSSGAPCRADPSQVQVDIPTDNSVQAVELSWVPGAGRPSLAPSPASQQVVLPVAKGPAGPVPCQAQSPAPSGTIATCWNWPASLDYTAGSARWLLNGAYSIAACSSQASDGSCTASGNYSPAVAEVAVAPGRPTQVAASESGGGVTVTWNPGPEPDLVGYTVSRDGQPVYTCSTDAAGLDAGNRCANPPSFQDRPGAGGWNYDVTALRYGADSSSSHYVASPPGGSSVSVPVSAPASTGGVTPTPGAPPGRAFVPALPPSGVMRPAQMGSGGVPADAAPALAGGEDSGGAATGNPTALPYQDDPAVKGSLASGTLAARQKARDRIDSAAELALAAIALALAVHVWYVRGELRVASVRVAARRAAREAAG